VTRTASRIASSKYARVIAAHPLRSSRLEDPMSLEQRTCRTGITCSSDLALRRPYVRAGRGSRAGSSERVYGTPCKSINSRKAPDGEWLRQHRVAALYGS
jgi:hypothetical protein